MGVCVCVCCCFSSLSLRWGLTSNGVDTLLLSDGSSTIYALSLEMKLLQRIYITDNGTQIDGLNELEWIHGQVTDILIQYYSSTRKISISP